MEQSHQKYILDSLEKIKPLKETLLVNPNTLVQGNIIPKRLKSEREEIKSKCNKLIRGLQSYLTGISFTAYTAKQLSSMYASENLGKEYVENLLKEDETMGHIPKKYQKLLKKPNNNDKYITKFKRMKQLKEEILNQEWSEAKEFNSYNKQIQDIYHTIEAETMGASDMYNVMKALQYQVRKSREVEKNSTLEHLKRELEQLGGMTEYNIIKNYLTDKGVNVHELN